MEPFAAVERTALKLIQEGSTEALVGLADLTSMAKPRSLRHLRHGGSHALPVLGWRLAFRLAGGACRFPCGEVFPLRTVCVLALVEGAAGGGGELPHHREEEAAIAFAEVGGVALDLGEEVDFALVQGEAGHLANGLVGEELAEGKLQGTGDLLQGLEGRDGVAVFYARKIAAEQAGALFNIALRHTALKAELADGDADVDRRRLQRGSRGGRQCCMHVCH